MTQSTVTKIDYLRTALITTQVEQFRILGERHKLAARRIAQHSSMGSADPEYLSHMNVSKVVEDAVNHITIALNCDNATDMVELLEKYKDSTNQEKKRLQNGV